MLQWVVESILHGGPIELFPIYPVFHDWYDKSCGMYCPDWDGAYKRPLVANWQE